MKNRIKYIVSGAVLIGLMGSGFTAYAAERIGSLVFESMRKLEQRQEKYKNKVKNIRAEREQAILEKKLMKENFLQQKAGSLDKKEYHAKYSYPLSKLYYAIYRELGLSRDVSRGHITDLRLLENGLNGIKKRVNQRMAHKIVQNGKDFLASSSSLLQSIAKYKDLMNDARVNQKLNSAYATSVALENYIKNLESSEANTDYTERILMEKVNALIQGMEALYVEAGILMDMIKDRSQILHMINQVAASDLATIWLAGGEGMVASLQEQVLGPLKDIIGETDDDLGVLAEGLELNPAINNGSDQSWSDGFTLIKGGSNNGY